MTDTHPMPFLSLVGLSPGAVALPPAGVLERNPGCLSRGFLLETQAIAKTGIGRRLQVWARDALHVDCELVSVPDDPTHLRGSLTDLLRARGVDGPVVCNASAGTNAHDLALAAAVHPESTFLYSSFRGGLCSARYSPAELMEFSSPPDLGLDTLLSLWGQAERWSSTAEVPAATRRTLGWKDLVPLIKARVVWDLDLALEGRSHRLDAAYEARGELHGLFLRPRSDWAHLKAVTVERRIGALRRRLAETGLRFRPVVVTDWPLVAERFRESGMYEVIPLRTPPGRLSLGRWLSPGHTPAGQAETPPGDPHLGSITSTTAATGSGSGRLAVCLGNDPSSTLVAIATHAPAEAWICYTPEVEVVRARLEAQLIGTPGNLPLQRVHWVRTDVYGRGIRKALAGAWSQAPGVVNVSPGTKGQTLALAGVPHASVWSLRAHAQDAICLDDGTTARLAGPPLEVQARVAGGRINLPEFRWDQAQFAAYSGFYRTLADELRAQGGKWGRIRTALAKVSMSPPRWTTWPNSVLFELAAGFRLRQAGADEVMVGVEWRTDTGQPRDELDVIARFGARFVALECKAMVISAPTRLGELSAEHSARTRACLGRFALPVLVVAAGAKFRGNRHGSETWAAGMLGVPTQVRRKITEAFRHRSTSQS